MTNALRELLTATINAAWASSPPLPLIYDNQKGAPEREPWARVSYQFGENLPAQIGLKMERLPGIVWVQVFIPPEKGTKVANLTKDKLAAVLVGNLNFTDRGDAGNLAFTNFGTGPDPAGSSGGFNQYNCQFTFTADVRRS